MQKIAIILMMLVVLLSACLSPLENGSPATPIATAAPALTGTPTPFSTVASSIPTVTSVPIPQRPNYNIITTFDYDRHFVSVDETILYPNHTGVSLDSLTLAIGPEEDREVFRTAWQIGDQ